MPHDLPTSERPVVRRGRGVHGDGVRVGLRWSLGRTTEDTGDISSCDERTSGEILNLFCLSHSDIRQTGCSRFPSNSLNQPIAREILGQARLFGQVQCAPQKQACFARLFLKSPDGICRLSLFLGLVSQRTQTGGVPSPLTLRWADCPQIRVRMR